MPADLNRVTLIGRLTRDPEVAYTAAGDPVATLRLAVSSRTKSAEDTWADKPNYFDVTVWGRQATAAGEHLAKGRRVGVDGRLSWREWETPDGARRQGVEVVASDLFYLDSRREQTGQDTPQREPVPAGASSAASDDDIPF